MSPRWTVFVDYDDRPPAPTLELESTQGIRVNIKQYRHRYNLVLYFPLDEVNLASALSEIGSRRTEYFMEDARVLVFLSKKVGQETISKDYPFPVLVDISGFAREKYLALLPAGKVHRSFFLSWTVMGFLMQQVRILIWETRQSMMRYWTG